VCFVFLSTDKNRCETYKETQAKHMVCQNLTVAFSGGLAAEIKIPFPPAKHDFNNSVSLIGFESQATRQQAQSSWGTPVMIYSFCCQ